MLKTTEKDKKSHISRTSANWVPLFEVPKPDDEYSIGIKRFYIHGFSHVRVHVRQGYTYGSEPVKEFFLSREHPQAAIIRAATFLFDSAKEAYGYTEEEFTKLLEYVTSDEFWERYYRIALKWQAAGKNPSYSLEGKANLNILTPYQSTRNHETKFVSMSTNPKSNAVTIKTTSYLLMRSNPELEQMALKHTCHSYSEIFRVLSLFTAVGLSLFTKENREKFGQQYVLAVYFNYASSWRHKIEHDGLEGYFFDHESNKFGLNLASFAKRVDAELNHISGTKIFGHSIENIELLGPSFIREGLSTSNDVFESYNENRTILLQKIKNNYPDHFTTKDLQSYCRELGMKTFHANLIVKWGGITPYTYGNNTWFVSDVECESDCNDQLSRPDRLMKYILDEMQKRNKVFFKHSEVAVLFGGDLTLSKLQSASYSSDVLVRKTSGHDSYFCAREHANLELSPAAGLDDIDSLKKDHDPQFFHASVDKDFILRLSSNKSRVFFSGISICFSKQNKHTDKYHIKFEYLVNRKKKSIPHRNLRSEMLKAVRTLVERKSFKDPEAVYKESHDIIMRDDFFVLLGNAIKAKAEQINISETAYKLDLLDNKKARTYLKITRKEDRFVCKSELSKPHYKLIMTLGTVQEVISFVSFHCYKVIHLGPEQLADHNDFIDAVYDQVSKALADAPDYSGDLIADDIKCRVNSEALQRQGKTFFEGYTTIENGFVTEADWKLKLERAVYDYLLNLAVGTTFSVTEIRTKLKCLQMKKSDFAFKKAIEENLKKYGSTLVPGKSAKVYIRRKFTKKLTTKESALS